jgi:hypothetical protein
VISVDGAWDAPGLNLSHWPGNRTPGELKHDLSTGVALNFARLDEERQHQLASCCRKIVNNHFDTDGTCALYAVRHPRAALQRESALLEAAAAGDLFKFPSERALCIDSIVTGFTDEPSPFAARLAHLDDEARHDAATQILLEDLPALLDGELGPYRALWEPELERTRADCAALARCRRDDLVHLDWTVWTAEAGAFTAGDPGRHALFGTTAHDRVLVALPRDGGTCFRLLVSTLSWFDLVTRTAHPRPNLAELAARLNELEGTHDGAAHAWRHQAADSPSPELWFGAVEHEHFAERCGALRPSCLAPRVVTREVADALRAALALPA